MKKIILAIALAASIAMSWTGDWVLVGSVIKVNDGGLFSLHMVFDYSDSYSACREAMANAMENDVLARKAGLNPTWLYKCVPDNRLCFEFPTLSGCY